VQNAHPVIFRLVAEDLRPGMDDVAVRNGDVVQILVHAGLEPVYVEARRDLQLIVGVDHKGVVDPAVFPERCKGKVSICGEILPRVVSDDAGNVIFGQEGANDRLCLVGGPCVGNADEINEFAHAFQAPPDELRLVPNDHGQADCRH
jgi:hypothetical protein